MQQVRKNNLLAAAALAMVASSPSAAADPGYAIPSKWAHSSGRSGGQARAHDAADRERNRQKMAKKSRRDQRRRAKGKA